MYTVKERIEETGGKDYSIFDVVSPDGIIVASYSALDYGGGAAGVENAEYDALEKRIELNAELRSKQVQNAFVSEVVANVNLEQETEALRQRIAELEAQAKARDEAIQTFILEYMAGGNKRDFGYMLMTLCNLRDMSKIPK